jgi:hypothetical protein
MLKQLLTQIEPTYWYCMGGVVLFFAVMVGYSVFTARRGKRSSF